MSTAFEIMVERLIESSAEKINWKASASGLSCAAVVGDRIVEVWMIREGTLRGPIDSNRYYNEDEYGLTIKTRDGDIVVEVATHRQPDEEITQDPFSLARNLEKLFHLARRRAMKFEDAVSEIVASLD